MMYTDYSSYVCIQCTVTCSITNLISILIESKLEQITIEALEMEKNAYCTEIKRKCSVGSSDLNKVIA